MARAHADEHDLGPTTERSSVVVGVATKPPPEVTDATPPPPLSTPAPREELDTTPIPTPEPSWPNLFRPSVTNALADSIRHPRGQIWPELPKSASPKARATRAVARLIQGYVYHDIGRIAPAMAFHFFLSLLPLLAFVGYALGLVVRSGAIDDVLAALLKNVPPSTQAVLAEEVGHLANAGGLGPLAAIGFLWIASGGIQGLMEGVEMVIGAPRRSWWKQRLIAVGWVLATLVAFAVASFGLIQWDNVVDPRAHEILRSGGDRVLTVLLSLGVAIGFLAAFYRFSVTHEKTVARRVLPGALLAVSLIVIVSSAFTFYIRTLTNYTVYYGSLAAVAVLLVWLWLMSLAILVGAELNAQLEGIRD